MPLVPTLLSSDANYITNGIILFIRWKQLKQVSHESFGHVMLLEPVQEWHDTNSIVSGTILFLGQDD